MGTQELQKTQCCKYLGILIDCNLKWCDHITYLYNKLIRYAPVLYKITTKLTSDIRRMIYFAFFHPLLLYGIEIYANTTMNHLAKLINYCAFCSKSQVEHILFYFIERITLYLYNCCTIIRF